MARLKNIIRQQLLPKIPKTWKFCLTASSEFTTGVHKTGMDTYIYGK
jgi:hypothetical protein